MMQLSVAAQALSATRIGADVRFDSVGSDSRDIKLGQLFVALKGPNFDGNAFAEEALSKGAAAVMVSEASATASPALLVDDTRLALGRLAQYWRNQFDAPVVAITGSNGKTTTKEMLTAILAVATGSGENVHATVGNLNNDIGLPLTLLKMRAHHEYAVLEMGMNHLGEVEYLSHIAKPDVALINNAGTAHIGELGSREKIAQAKGEIFSGLKATGVAVVNADSDFSNYWRALNAQRNVVTFGLNTQADVSARYQPLDSSSLVTLTTPTGSVEFRLSLQGVHNVSNALAASAAAFALGIPNQTIAKGLERFSGVHGRLERKTGLRGAALIDDTYNANPDSMKAAIDVLANMSAKPILVLGDMGELGSDAEEMHTQIGAYAKAAGVTKLYCLGNSSVATVKGFGAGAKHFDSAEALAAEVGAEMAKGVVVLVKGSRFMRMERVVNLLAQNSFQGEQ